VTLAEGAGAPRASATWLRLGLLAAGLALVAWLVAGVGAARVGELLAACARWLPLIVALEIAFVATDLVAARALLGGADVSPRMWVRSAALAYAATTLLPAGRAAGEATRAATLAPAVGAVHATAVCARLQIAVLAANALFSLVVAALMASRGDTLLGVALAGNGVVCGALAAALFVVVRNARAGRWLRQKFARFVAASPDTPPPSTAALARATASCLVGRAIQAVQYGVVVAAVGGAASPANALTAQAIHLVGAAVGDAIPGQVGALEGAYRTFAATLGFAGDPARALSIALAVRVAQLALAASCLVVSTFVVRAPRPSVA